MFHYDGGLFLSAAKLAVDVRRRQPRCFVSHAHADHIARHELALATPGTACLYRHRLGPRHRVLEMGYRQAIEFAGLRLTAYSAGHCLGSAMLLADDGAQTLLYTGDFKLDASATSEPAELPHADILIMESTFGRPHYRLPPRTSTVARLLELVHAALREGKTPVVHAYPLGKSQEVTRLITESGVPALQHRDIHAISCIYQQCGVDLGDFALFDGRPLAGHAVVTLPAPRASSACRGSVPRCRSPSLAGHSIKTPNISSASTTLCRSRIMPTSISSSKPSAASSRAKSTAPTARLNSPTTSAISASTLIRSKLRCSGGCFEYRDARATVAALQADRKLCERSFP